jgi:UDP-N-acetylglucosamine:LPS N-acetylglucosamine transferase
MEPKTILLIYGSGGHNEQMRRLFDAISPELSDCHFISLCDDDVKYVLTSEYYIVPTVTHKYSYLKGFFKVPYSIYTSMKVIRELRKLHAVDYAISTGPGISIIAAILLKRHQIPMIFIETWSRFYSKSISGRIMYYLAKHFFVQNEGLLKIYPKAVYKGRL